MKRMRPGAVLAPIEPFSQARLNGPSPKLDLRVDAVRGDIIDIALRGRVSASRYTTPTRMVCRSPRASMRATAADAAVAVSELLFGEAFDVFDTVPGWSWGRTTHDNYLGWVDTAALVDPDAKPGHGVTVPLALVFAEPNIKAPVLATLPFGARLAGVRDGDFLTLSGGGYVSDRHVEHGRLPGTPLDVARLFTGAPYLWGGRTPLGVDCSGLVQAALTACEIPCPRDSDQQFEALGVPVVWENRQAGDIIFFPGHVGIFAAHDRLFHANAYWMTTCEEPLAAVIARLQAAGVAEPVLGVKRL